VSDELNCSVLPRWTTVSTSSSWCSQNQNRAWAGNNDHRKQTNWVLVALPMRLCKWFIFSNHFP